MADNDILQKVTKIFEKYTGLPTEDISDLINALLPENIEVIHFNLKYYDEITHSQYITERQKQSLVLRLIKNYFQGVNQTYGDYKLKEFKTFIKQKDWQSLRSCLVVYA